MINLHTAARAIYYANLDAGIESVYVGPWEALPPYAQGAYSQIAGEVLRALHLDYVANEADHANHS